MPQECAESHKRGSVRRVHKGWGGYDLYKERMVSDMSTNENNDVDLKNLLKEAFDSTNKDKNYNARKALVGLIPHIGSPLAEFYTTYVSNPAQERLLYFLENLVDEFEKIKNTVKGFTIESLESDPIFSTMLIRSMEIVRRTHQKEKILLVKNLLLNSALIDSVNDDDLKLLFLDLIDELKLSQFNLLFLINNYANYNKKQTVLDAMYANPLLYSIFLKQLIAQGLVSFEEAYKDAVGVEKDAKNLNISITEYVKRYRGSGLQPAVFEVMSSSDNLLFLLIPLLETKQNCMTKIGYLFVKFLKSPLQEIS